MSSTFRALKIGGHEVKVIYENDPTVLGNRMGNTICTNNTIRISTDYPASQQEVTLLHEILHFVFFNLGYDHGSEPHSEQLVEALSQGLYQVLKDNNISFGGLK